MIRKSVVTPGPSKHGLKWLMLIAKSSMFGLKRVSVQLEDSDGTKPPQPEIGWLDG